MKILTKKDLEEHFKVDRKRIGFRSEPFAPNDLVATKKIIQGNEIQYRDYLSNSNKYFYLIYHPEWNRFIDALMTANIKIASFDSQIKSLSYEAGSLDANGKGIMGWAVCFENSDYDFFLAEPKENQYDL